MKERIIKTITPFIVGWIVALLATVGVELTPEVLLQLQNALTLLFGSIYYVVVVLLSKRFPAAEALLGSSKKPKY